MWLAAFIPLPLDSIYSLFNLLFDRWISGLEFDGGGGITPCYVALPPETFLSFATRLNLYAADLSLSSASCFPWYI